jgi:hypothetical protein
LGLRFLAYIDKGLLELFYLFMVFLLRIPIGIITGTLINIYFLFPKYGVFLNQFGFIWNIAMTLNILIFIIIIKIVIWNIKNVYLSTIKKFIIKVAIFYWSMIGILTVNIFDSHTLSVVE